MQSIKEMSYDCCGQSAVEDLHIAFCAIESLHSLRKYLEFFAVKYNREDHKENIRKVRKGMVKCVWFLKS